MRYPLLAIRCECMFCVYSQNHSMMNYTDTFYIKVCKKETKKSHLYYWSDKFLLNIMHIKQVKSLGSFFLKHIQNSHQQRYTHYQGWTYTLGIVDSNRALTKNLNSKLSLILNSNFYGQEGDIIIFLWDFQSMVF